MDSFRAARDFLIRYRDDYDTAYRDFRWPALDRFNWALAWFDQYAAGNGSPALRVVNDDGSELAVSFEEMRRASNRTATSCGAAA
jgi:acetyl-CoA synthetase